MEEGQAIVDPRTLVPRFGLSLGYCADNLLVGGLLHCRELTILRPLITNKCCVPTPDRQPYYGDLILGLS
jgi:hypothetical protein